MQEAFPCLYASSSGRPPGRTGQNNSCQQAALSLAFRMHVLSAFINTMVRRAIGLSLCLRKCLRPTMVIDGCMAWGGLALGLDTSACPSIPQACIHRFHDINLRLQLGGFTLSTRQLPAEDQWSGLGGELAIGDRNDMHLHKPTVHF